MMKTIREFLEEQINEQLIQAVCNPGADPGVCRRGKIPTL